MQGHLPSTALGLALLCCASLAWADVGNGSKAACPAVGLQRLPQRPIDAPTGHEFARHVRELSGPARDALIVAEVFAGNVPSFLRRLIPVNIAGDTPRGLATLTVCVAPDYLAVGSDADFMYVPVGLRAAMSVASRYDLLLPTTRLVDAIYAASPVKLVPQPLPPGDQMRSTAYVLWHSELIVRQRAGIAEPPDMLTAGAKKDLVLTERLWQLPGRVAIYGWHRAAGSPIQPLSTVHGERYADYSHGVRLLSRVAYVNGQERRLEDLLADPQFAPLLSREGPMREVAQRLELLAGPAGG